MASIDRVLASSQRRWIEDLWSGLKLLAESDLRDFEPLHSAKRALSAQEQAAWTELMGDLESRVVESMREEVDEDAIFVELLASLNARWCLEREILVSRSKRVIWGDHEPDLWDAVPASIHATLDGGGHGNHPAGRRVGIAASLVLGGRAVRGQAAKPMLLAGRGGGETA